ncbi:MAG: pitrilysin family protein [Gemmataceae bacterium]
MQFHKRTLPNGLTVIGETSPSALSAAVGFFVRTGSRDETPDVSGVSHFLEHMVFKGTPRRSAFDVNRDFDRIGANYNAFTSEENTVFYAAVLPEYLPQVVDILADILRPSLRGDDFDMEKNVILEEIEMYEDQPGSSAYDHAKRHYFASHPLGNSILGTATSITALSRDQMAAYFSSRYVASNVTAVAAGNFDFDRFVELCANACGSWNGATSSRGCLTQASGSGAIQYCTKEKVTQEYVIMMSAAPAASDVLRHAADTLALAIGDDTGSRLYWALVDPGLAESADMSFSEYDAAGAYYTSYSCDPDQATANLEIIRKVLTEVQRDGITADELARAKCKIGSRVVRGSERPMGRMQALGMSWTYLGQYRSVDDELKAFDAVTLDSIREVLNQFPIDDPTTLALGPLTG